MDEKTLIWNDLFHTLNLLERDTPGKTFWNAKDSHPAIYRALKMDRTEIGAVFAAAAFRLHIADDGATVLFASPSLRILEDQDEDWLAIEDVLSWDPISDTATILGDPGQKLFGHSDPTQPLHIFASPFAYLRHIAEARAQWFVHWRTIKSEWRAAHEPERIPGLLLIGNVDEVRWPRHDMPNDITVHGIDARALNSALIRQAGIPRVTAQKQRKAA